MNIFQKMFISVSDLINYGIKLHLNTVKNSTMKKQIVTKNQPNIFRSWVMSMPYDGGSHDQILIGQKTDEAKHPWPVAPKRQTRGGG
jgi:hypothetical protein